MFIDYYSRSSRKRPPRDREFEDVVVTRTGRLQEYDALVSDPMAK